MNDKIICLVGESGSGKTTIAKLLEERGFNVIQSYTTRPQREENEWGHTFSDSALLQEHIMTGKVIAFKYYDNHHYWAIKEQYKNRGISIYVVDPDGIEMLLSNVHDAEIVIVYLKTDRHKRFERMTEQGRSIGDASRRIDYDTGVFRKIRCNWIVDANGSVEDTVRLVVDVIDSTDADDEQHDSGYAASGGGSSV